MHGRVQTKSNHYAENVDHTLPVVRLTKRYTVCTKSPLWCSTPEDMHTFNVCMQFPETDTTMTPKAGCNSAYFNFEMAEEKKKIAAVCHVGAICAVVGFCAMPLI